METQRSDRVHLPVSVLMLPLLLLGACGGQGPTEEEIQARIDGAVAEALDDAPTATTSIESVPTTPSTQITTTTASTQTTTTAIPTTTTFDLLDPEVVRTRFLEKAEQEVAKVAERLPVEGITPDHSAQYRAPYAFDIETTDSIISPYEGTLVIPMLWYYQGELTGLMMYLHATYRYTDFEWVFASAVRYLDETTPDLSPSITQWAESLFR